MQKNNPKNIFVFPALDAGFRSRKKAYQACEQCKRARRKCLRTDDLEAGDNGRCVGCRELNIPCSFQNDIWNENNQYLRKISRAPRSEDLSSRFVSHLDPSADLLADEGDPDKDDVGIWVPQRSGPPESIQKVGKKADIGGSTISSIRSTQAGSDTLTRKSPLMTSKPTKIKRLKTGNGAAIPKSARSDSMDKIVVDSPPSIPRSLVTHLNALQAFEFPPKEVKNGLINIYFEEIQPLLPLVDEPTFRHELETDEASYPLVHAVILAACKHARARKLLQIYKKSEHDRGYVRSFAVRTDNKLRALMFARIEKRPITLARIHALMSFHSEGSDGSTNTMNNIALAFSFAHSTGIHLSGGRNENRGDGYCSAVRMWRALWCLDRLFSVSSSSPVHVNATDIGADAWIDHDSHNHVSTVEFIESVKLLDETIMLYRPASSNVKYYIPSSIEAYASLPLEMPPDDQPLTAFSRLIGHVVVILSYKRGKSQVKTEAEYGDILINRSLEIYRIVENYDLAPLHIIVYAVSLTLPVILKYFFRPGVRHLWRRCCAILDSLSPSWYLAEVMSSMGKRIFDKLEKQYEAKRETEIQIQDDFAFSVPFEHLDDLMPSSFDSQLDALNEFDRDLLDLWLN